MHAIEEGEADWTNFRVYTISCLENSSPNCIIAKLKYSKMTRHAIICILVFFASHVGAQSGRTPGIVAGRIIALKEAGADFRPIDVVRRLEKSDAGDSSWTKDLKSADLYILDTDQMANLLTNKYERVSFQIPTSEGMVELDLQRVDITSAGFEVVASDDGRMNDYEGGLHYRGCIRGNSTSLAAISFFSEEVVGFVSDSYGDRILGRIKGDIDNRHIFYRTKDLHNPKQFKCSTADDGPGYQSEELSFDAGLRSVDCVRIYWEVNYDIYQDYGSISNTANFVTGLFNQSATLFDNDGISVLLSEVFVWNTPSPYTGSTSLALLSQFQGYRNSFNGDLAHLLDYSNDGGRAAGFAGLCPNNLDQSMCYSGIDASYSGVPNFSWSVYVVTHEQGHLLGSRHTHACVWNGNNTPIDGCGPADGIPYEGGPCGTAPVPSNGTIMSYCHLVGSYSNFNNGFGIQPTSVILNYINSQSCLTACSSILSNDACEDAELLISQTYCDPSNGTVEGANPDGFPQIPSCDNAVGHPQCTVNPDRHGVFYRFVAVSSTHTITVDPIGNGAGSLDAVVTVYEGEDCFNLDEFACVDTPGGQGGTTILTHSGFVPGNEYWVRIYDWCSAGNVTNGNFEICVTHSGTGLCPDPTISSLTFDPPNPSVGQEVDFDIVVTNVGTASTEAANDPRIEYWVNGVYTGEDDDETTVLGPGESNSESLTNYVFSAPGTYTVCAILDPYPGECPTNNNTTCAQVTVCNADLTPILISALPITVCPGGTVPIVYSINNSNCSDLSFVEWEFYRSSDMTLDAGDVLISGTTYASVPSGTAVEEVLDLSISGSTPPGTFYLLLVVDPSNGVPEGQLGEANNTLVIPIQVTTPPNVEAGSYGPICSNDPWLLLQGSPAGGVWIGTGVTGNLFDPTAGTQTLIYSVSQSGCSSQDQTIVVVNTPTTWYADVDGDGQGDGSSPLLSCAQPAGYVSNNSDPCPLIPNGLPGQACDDGNPCTTNDQISASCGCVGTPVGDADNDGLCDLIDPCPTLANVEPGDACNDGDPCTINDQINTGCGCAGTPVGDADNDGLCDLIDPCPTLANVEPGDECDDGDPDSVNDVVSSVCICQGVAPVDCEGNSGGPALPGTSCDDNEPCTTDETYDSDCNCIGTIVDTDGDGVCDALDECPLLTGQIGSPCDDGDSTTGNDSLDGNCNCVGLLLDCLGVPGGSAEVDACGVCYPNGPADPLWNSTCTTSLCDCWIAPDASYTLALAPNDDGSSSLINLPFQFSLYGDLYAAVYINNNGNISFQQAFGTYTSTGFPNATYRMIAPFWADVDTRSGGGQILYKLTPTALYVNWVEVAHYNQQTDRRNSFQVIITNGSDPAVRPGSNVSFCYKEMQWTTGSASGGFDGFGGTPASIGVNRALNTGQFAQIGRFATPTEDFDGPAGAVDGVYWLNGREIAFNTNVSTTNIPPVLVEYSGCDTIVLCAGETQLLSTQFLAPEETQIATISIMQAPNFVSDTLNQPGLLSRHEALASPELSDVGYHQYVVLATDNGLAPQPSAAGSILHVVPPPSIIPPALEGPQAVSGSSTFTYSVLNPVPGTYYQWSIEPPGWEILSGQGEPVLTTLSPLSIDTGTTVCVTPIVANCVGPDSCMAVGIGTSVFDTTAPYDVRIVPNPSDGSMVLMVSGLPTDMLRFDVYDAAGRMMTALVTPIPNVGYHLHLPDAATGMYTLHCYTPQGRVTRKFIVQR